MRVRSRSSAAVVVSTAVAVAVTGLLPAFAASAAPSSAWPTATLAKQLTSPKGATLDAHGNLVVAQNAFGAPSTAAPLVSIDTAGKNKGRVRSKGAKRSLVAIARSPKGGYWTLGVDGVLYYQAGLKSKAKKVRDLKAWGRANPDPYSVGDDPSDPPTDSNPFGLAVNAAGNALVTDAALNTLVKVTRTGTVTVVARFAPQEVQTGHLPAEMREGLPSRIPAESVPTGIAVAKNGAVYVGELKGFPFRPGSSRIYKVAPNAKGAVCSANPQFRSRACATVHKDLTAIASLALNPAGGVVVVQYARAGIMAFEGGCFGPGGCPPAVVLKIDRGGRTELSKGRFAAPGSIVAAGPNRFYVTDAMFSPGGGRVTRLGR